MADVFATIIVTADKAEQARAAAAAFSGGDGMFTSELSASGNLPATHYISSGIMPEEIVDALSMCEVSDLPPAEAIEQAGLKQCVSG